jgi:hypothetical protein
MLLLIRFPYLMVCSNLSLCYSLLVMSLILLCNGFSLTFFGRRSKKLSTFINILKDLLSAPLIF